MDSETNKINDEDVVTINFKLVHHDPFRIDVNKDISVKELKEKVSFRLNTLTSTESNNVRINFSDSLENIRLIYKGKLLKSEMKLVYDYQFNDGDTIHIVINPIGNNTDTNNTNDTTETSNGGDNRNIPNTNANFSYHTFTQEIPPGGIGNFIQNIMSSFTNVVPATSSQNGPRNSTNNGRNVNQNVNENEETTITEISDLDDKLTEMENQMKKFVENSYRSDSGINQMLTNLTPEDLLRIRNLLAQSTLIFNNLNQRIQQYLFSSSDENNMNLNVLMNHFKHTDDMMRRLRNLILNGTLNNEIRAPRGVSFGVIDATEVLLQTPMASTTNNMTSNRNNEDNEEATLDNQEGNTNTNFDSN